MEVTTTRAKGVSRRQAFLLVAISTALGCLAAAGAAEIYFRRREAVSFLTPGCGWISDPATGFANPPNLQCRAVTPEFDYIYTLNSDGHPDDEFNPDPKACTVMALGDSHTLAVGVTNRDTWPNVAEKLMRPSYSMPFQVINMGVAGYSIGQEYQLIKKFISKYKPRHVVVGFSMATDAYDIRTPAQGGFIYGAQFNRPYFDVEDSKLVLRSPEPRGPALKNSAAAGTPEVRAANLGSELKAFMFDHSALFRATYRGAIGQYAVRFLRRYGVNPWPSAETVLARELTPVDAKSWLTVEKVLDDMRRFLAAEQTGFTLVMIPYLPQVYDQVWERTFGSEPERYDRFAGNKRLRRICDQYGLDCLDLTEPFIAAVRAQKKWLHYAQDAHPTPEGQFLIGKLVAERLRSRLTCELR